MTTLLSGQYFIWTTRINRYIWYMCNQPHLDRRGEWVEYCRETGTSSLQNIFTRLSLDWLQNNLLSFINLSQFWTMFDLFMPSIAWNKASLCLTVLLCVDRLQNAEGIISDGHGNYTEDNKCMWLVDTGQNRSLWFQFHQFSTECGWDHLYIYDGDSAFAPLLAAFRYLVPTFSCQ